MNGKSDSPPGWPDGELSKFFDMSHSNIWATFASLPDVWALMNGIDAVFHSYASTCMEHIRLRPTDDPAGLLLLCNTNSQLRAALRLCASGHAVAVYPVGRAALESALYGWYLLMHPEASVRWHDKPQSPGKDRDRWAGEFCFGNIRRKLQPMAAETAARAQGLHETAIAFGSHPNTQALYSNIKVEKDANGAWVGLHFLHGWDSASANAAKFSCEVGLVALELVLHADPSGAKQIDLGRQFSALVQKYDDLVASWTNKFGRT